MTTTYQDAADRLLTAEEAAPRLGLSVHAVRRLTRLGRIPVVQLSIGITRYHMPTILAKCATGEKPALR